jgi:hypothetical protein
MADAELIAVCKTLDSKRVIDEVSPRAQARDFAVVPGLFAELSAPTSQHEPLSLNVSSAAH